MLPAAITTSPEIAAREATTNRITSTGGATPVIDISASYVGQTSITTLGTIATGAIPASKITTGTFSTGAYVMDTSLLVPTLYGSSAANGDISIEGTSSATKTTSSVILQPTGGNVGIGTAAPGSSTYVHLKYSSATYDAMRFEDIGAGGRTWLIGAGTGAGGGFGFYDATAAALRMFIASSGFVAIGGGVSAPSAPIELTADGFSLKLRAPTASSYGSFRIYNDQNSSTRTIEIGYTGSTYTGPALVNGIGGECAYFTSTGAYPLQIGTNNTFAMAILSGGNVGIGVIAPTSVLHLKAGTATASTAPLKFNSGTKMTTPEVGGIEYDANNFYVTKNTAIRESLPGVLFTQTADKSVTNTTSETSIVGTGVGGLTLPANFFVAGKTIRVTMSGVYSTVAVTGDTVTIKVKYGSTVLASKATTALVTGGTNLFWASEILVTCRSTGGSGTVQVSGGVIYQIATSATVEDELNNGVATTTLDTTASGLFDVTVTHSAANASNTVKSLVGSFEVLN